ncbi:MAG: D-alanyl-D-alanine carboxypeptidase, partial [Rhizobiales bacterium]|nr:D-alanyl-D-alanine carboxypeptidase [Hyphomicrobiales bacterium]
MLLSISAAAGQPKPQGKRRFVDALAALLAGLFALLLVVQPVSARQPFATIAIDARTGKVLYSRSADARRYPASLTKVMTLYLVFEDLKAGKIKLNTKLRVSKYASRRPPSKLGLKPGDTIRVRDAIGALVTKSANDVASTVAENLSGSEAAFARRMTSKARDLGMTRTTFRNASGLPDRAQVTTVRDMATLALRIQRDFPKEYRYFSMRSYKYGRRNYRNHNRLLGRTKGVDGIKTGYTRASGFNLVTSARRGKKRVIAVVVGAKSGGSRNRYMSSLINRMFKTKRLTSGSHLARVAGTPPGYTSKKAITLAKAKSTLPPLPRAKPVQTDDIGLVAASSQPAISKKVEIPT